MAAGAKWELIWADFKTADGIVGTADGGVMFAQEQTDTIRKLTPDGKEYTVIPDTRGAGSISMDAQGRLYAAERTCTEPLNKDLGGCNELTKITQYLARAARARKQLCEWRHARPRQRRDGGR